MRILHVSLFTLFLSLSGCHATMRGGVLAARSAVVLGQHWADHGVVRWGWPGSRGRATA